MFDIGSDAGSPGYDPSALTDVIHQFSLVRSDLICHGALSDVDDNQLCELALNIESLRRGLDSLSITVLAELDARGTTDTVHGMRTGSWLANNALLPGGGSRSRVKVADRVRRHFPEIASSLESGAIGFDHAKVLVDAANPRIIDEFKPFVTRLIDLVPLMTFERWKKEVEGVAALLDQDGGHNPGDDITDNTLTLSPGMSGTLGIKGQLCGDNAIIVFDAISERADQIFHRMKNDAKLAGGVTGDLKIPPRRTLLALALSELVREALGKPASAASAPTVAPRTDVSLVINAANPDLVTDSNGTPIGDTSKFTLLCDPIFRPVVMNTEGMVIDLGRDQRLVNDALRRALFHRDGGCVWPGCENPATWCDAHHVQHWINNGRTDLANTGLLCRYHHGVTHRKGWSMHATDDQWFWWESPSGKSFWSQRHGKQRTGCPPPPPSQSPNAPPSNAPPRPSQC